MSYSFNVKGGSKIEAKAEVALSLAALKKTQPEHAADADQAEITVGNFIDLLANDPDKGVAVTVVGSVWNTSAGILEAGVSVTARLVPKEAAKTGSK